MSLSSTPQQVLKSGYEFSPFSPDKLRPRKPRFKFNDTIPKLWVDGESYAYTHLMNSLSLFLPEFETMTVKAMRWSIDRIENRHLKNQVRNFIAQEVLHGQVHEDFLQVLRNQGYELKGFLKFIHWYLQEIILGMFGARFTLSIVAAFEHYVNILAVGILSVDILQDAEPTVKDFYKWHVAEEVEHSSVASEVLLEVDNSYLLRLAGNLLGSVSLLGFIFFGALYLLAQDKKLGSWNVWQDMYRFFLNKEYGLISNFIPMFLLYIKPNYRPEDKLDCSDSASQFLNHSSS